MDRRAFLLTGAAASVGTVAGGAIGAGLALGSAPKPLELKIQHAQYPVLETPTQNMVSLSPDAPPPVLRLRQGQPFAANVTNSLPDATAMHWHGIRVPNAMDGVPYLTQFPITGGETFHYAFTPKDAGTYWYHPHCMTMEQMARGLTGVLVVEEEDPPGFDADIAVNLRDFRLKDDGQFRELYTKKGAARAGTKGNVLTANWKQALIEDAPAGGLVRLRLAATDTTRHYKIALSGPGGQALEGQVIAWDGHPLETPQALPHAKAPMTLAPGQRADLALKMPAGEGQEIVVATMLGYREHPLARLRSIGAAQTRDLAELHPLRPNPISVPDLTKAERHEFVFGWAPSGDAPRNGLCGSMPFTFWSINRIPWAGDAAEGTGPLLTMDLGKSYILRFRNESPNQHPIHLHGLTFRVLRSNKRSITPHWTDTVLLGKNETVEIALVADNPGDWAFHCHVIEHQKTGLTGYLRVG